MLSNITLIKLGAVLVPVEVAQLSVPVPEPPEQNAPPPVALAVPEVCKSK